MNLFQPGYLRVAMCAAVAAAMTAGANAQTLIFSDEFNGSGNVDTTAWRLPFDSEGTFVGRTQFRGDAAVDVPQQVGGSAVLLLDSFSPIDPGNAFLGTDLLTKRNFARGGGLSIEARMRLDPTSLPAGVGGAVNGFFLFDVTRADPPGSGNLVRDEIDWELLSNEVVSGANRPATNYWNEGPFTGPAAGGDLQFHQQGVDLTQFNDYRIDWTPQSIKWYVNDNLVRTQTTNVPEDPMKLHFNLWASDDTFTAAFDAGLQPAATAGANQQIRAEIDRVEVNRFNTTVSDNLLTDGSFEIALGPTFIGDVPATTTGTWLSFGNVSYEADEGGMSTDPGVPDTAPDGVFMAKIFGPFNGNPDASGVLQNVAATPGQEFEARVQVQTPSGDSIAGTENFNTIALTFLDSSGAVLQEAFGDPSEFVDSNGNDFPLLDGRDPNLVEDLFVEGVVSGIAPAGTAFARVSLFFIQLNNEGGAAWFDDASLVLLTPDEVVGLPGDFNGDGVVDSIDYAVWRDNLGGDESALGGNGDGLPGVTSTDFDLWRDNFGATAAGSAGVAAAPEPMACLMVITALPLLWGRRRK